MVRAIGTELLTDGTLPVRASPAGGHAPTRTDCCVNSSGDGMVVCL